ncbi:MAG: putative baseplate assembly protein [bacterium]|nr:putative baseplate assembly protein [bacterium]
MQQYITNNETRRRKVQESATINGIDYLEVLDLDLVASEPEFRQRRLRVYFLKSVPITDPFVLTRDTLRVEGGQRIRDIQVIDVRPDPSGDFIEVDLDKAGDFSAYVFRLVKDRRSEEPPDGFDQILSQVDFSFKVECPNEFDCEEDEEQFIALGKEPPIDYLVKDYQSFRRLLLDRLTTVMPAWRERNPSDLGVAMVEIMAFAADYQSYYQDAVSTEAYLGTARRRVSVRRHARLLDYPMHDGCNARTWVALLYGDAENTDPVVLPAGSQFFTKTDIGRSNVPWEYTPPDPLPTVQSELDAVNAAIAAAAASRREVPAVYAGKAKIFESMYAIQLRMARNELEFYTFGEPSAILPKGSTSAVFKLAGPAGDLNLQAGDVLLFVEKRDPDTGRAFDANPDHRHVVRLNADPVAGFDDLFGVDTLEVSWYKSDALPFDLCLGEVEDEGGPLVPIAVAHANVVLADYGRTVSEEELIPPEAPQTGRYRPRLRLNDITQSEAYDHEVMQTRPASQASEQNFRAAEPAVLLLDDEEQWTARPDLLASDRFSTDFVLETESDGSATLRFGDNVLGKRPSTGTRFDVSYRVGNGRAGNIGGDSLAHIINGPEGITGVFNPLPAQGGVEPESIEEVKLYAPSFFKDQERAVTEEDYVRIAERNSEVQKAQATLRWTGSWYTVFISIDREGGLDVDAAFQEELKAFIDPFRLTGHDLEIVAPFFVGLEILLRVRVQEGFLESTVKAELLEIFSNVDLPDGRRGFFHPDNFTFGEPIYLSNVIALAMEVTGVERVDPVRFGRFGATDQKAITDGLIPIERLEIVRLDNDPNAPENGKIDFLMEGGL